MLEAPRTPSPRPAAGLSVWKLLHASLLWSPVSRRLAPPTMAITWGLMAAFPWLVGRAIDAVFPRGGAPISWPTVWMWSALMLAAGAAAFPLLAARHHTTMQNRLSTQFWLSAGVSTAVLEAGATGRDAFSAGDVLSTGSADVEAMADASMNIVQVWGWATAIAVALGLTATASLPITIGLVAAVCLSIAANIPVMHVFRKRIAKQRKAAAHLTDHAADGISGLRVLRGVGGQSQFLDEYQRRSRATLDASLKVAPVLAAMNMLSSLTPTVLTIGIVLWAAAEAARGAITPGEVVMIAGATRFLQSPLMSVAMFTSTMTRAKVASTRLSSVFAVPSAWASDQPTRTESTLPQADFVDDATGLRFKVGEFTTLTAADPFVAAQVGQRLGRLHADEPCARLAGPDGDSLAAWPLATVREHVVVNDTHPMLLSGTLRNQLDPWNAHDDDTLLAALYAAAAGDILGLLPEGLDDYVSERGRSLSGGQRQRVTLARVLVRNPPVLVLIEPTSAVDSYTESLVAQRIYEHRKGKTTIVITGSPMLLDVADTQLTLGAPVDLTAPTGPTGPTPAQHDGGSPCVR